MRVLAACCVLACAGFALGDSWTTPRPRVFACHSGEYALKVIPNAKGPFGKARATLYTLDTTGNQVVLWSSELVNVPVDVYVSDGGRVLTLNTWASVGFEHSVVVYGDEGKPVKDHPLESVLSREQIIDVPHSVSSRWWDLGPVAIRVPDGTDYGEKRIGKHRAWRPAREEAVVTTHAGHKVVVDLVTGAVRRG